MKTSMILFLFVLGGIGIYSILTIPLMLYIIFGYGIKPTFLYVIISGVVSPLLCILIIRNITKIKKYLTPYKWKTIWTHKSLGYRTTLGFNYRKIDVTVVVQKDNYKDAWRCYMTDGSSKTSCDINVIITEYPELRGILLNQGIVV